MPRYPNAPEPATTPQPRQQKRVRYPKVTAAAAVAAAAVVGSGTVLATASSASPAPGRLATAAVAGVTAPDADERAEITSAARRELTTRGIAVEKSSPVGTITVSDTYRAQQWGLDAIKAPAANTASTGSGVTVAVVDTGVAKVADLSGKILAGKDFIGTGDGTSDPHGHGTGVASIIAATAGNNIGLAGVAPNTRILPVRVCDAAGSCPMDTVAAGIIWAVNNGAQVINASLGGGETDALAAAVSYAETKGVTVAASVGNSAEQGNPVLYPGAYETVIGVGATDSTGKRAAFSEYGPQVDVAAPGVGIVQATANGGYNLGSGTSQAAPHVAAVAALAKAYKRTLSPTDIRTLITGTATDLGPAGRDDEFGAGLLDAEKVMTTLGARLTTPAPTPTKAAALPVVSSALPGSGTSEGGSVVTVSGSNLTTAVSVAFGDTPATSFTVLSANKLTAVTPAGTGTVSIKVTNSGGTSIATAVKHVYRAPLGAEFTDGTPARITGGTALTVTVTGGTVGATARDFAAEKVTAKVGGVNATASWVSPTSVKLLVPATTRSGAVTVQLFHDGIAGPESTSKVNYAPVVGSVTPAKVSAAGGATVTVNGSGFLGVDTADPSAVTFGGVPATSFTVRSATQITAVVPAGTDGYAPVTVTTTGGASAAANSARVLYRAVLGLTVPGGTAVKASGGPVVLEVTGGTIGANAKEFSAAGISVTAGNTRLVPVWVDATHLKVTLPASQNTSVVLTVKYDTITGGSTTVTYTPVVTSLSATNDNVAGGRQVTIRAAGSGVTAGTTFTFGGTAATCTSKGSGTSLTFTCTVPPAAQPGPASVAFTTPGGLTSRFTAAAAFAYTDID